jgi:hypothetical protein
VHSPLRSLLHSMAIQRRPQHDPASSHDRHLSARVDRSDVYADWRAYAFRRFCAPSRGLAIGEKRVPARVCGRQSNDRPSGSVSSPCAAGGHLGRPVRACPLGEERGARRLLGHLRQLLTADGGVARDGVHG